MSNEPDRAPVPALWKLAPAAVIKPWGLVHGEALRLTGIEVGVGELWLASAQTGPGNYSNVVSEPDLRADLAELLRRARAAGALEPLLGPTPLAHIRSNPHRGKTEAWCIRRAEGRTGVAAGPRSAADAARLKQIIQTDGLPPRVEEWSEEVRRLFGLIEPLEGDEVFLTLAGALHTMFAVGPESRLILDEVQQGYGQALLPTLTKLLMVQDDVLSVQVHPDDRTVADAAAGRLDLGQDLEANPTVRVYDFGRRPGEHIELGFRLLRPEAGLRRVRPLTVSPGAGHELYLMVADAHFIKSRIRLAAGRRAGLEPAFDSYHVLHCRSGRAVLEAGGTAMPVGPGETVFVPASLERELSVEAVSDCALFDDTLGEVASLAAFLESRGAGRAAVRALLEPAPALQAD